MLSGAQGVPGAPGARYSAMQSAGHHRAKQYCLWQKCPAMASQATPYASAFMAPPSWPMYMTSYMPRPPVQQVSMQAEFEELARQPQDLKARELEVQRMSRTFNLYTVRDATVMTAASVVGSSHSRTREQAPLKPRHASSQVACQRSLTASGAPSSGIKVSNTATTKTSCQSSGRN